MSAAAGALSSPMLEQLTTQDDWGPDRAQLQLTGHGPQLLPPSPRGPEPQASRQQSATSRLEKKLKFGTQTPCFRLDKVSPFPHGIAHSHLIAPDGVSPLRVGRETKRTRRERAAFRGSHVRKKRTEARRNFLDTVLCPYLHSVWSVPFFLKKPNGALLPQSFLGEKKKTFGVLPLSSSSSFSFYCLQFVEAPLGRMLRPHLQCYAVFPSVCIGPFTQI